MSPMADAEVTAAARMAARSRRAPDLWIAALGSISGDLARSRLWSPSRFPVSASAWAWWSFYRYDLEILHMFKYVRTVSVAIEVSGIGSILSLRLPLHFGMRPRKNSQP